MARKLPPLNALKAFEAAARHESFTKAADELCVTPGAISRQVQVLEEHLGLSLFTRKNREVVISDRGAIYRTVVTNAFDDINAATYKLRCDKKLHVSCYMTLSLRWLMPRLPSFHGANPNYSLMFTTTPPRIDEVSSGIIAVAILFGTGDWPGTVSHRLFPNELMPVCTPEVRETLDRSDPNDLSKTTLLHSQLRPHDWGNWLDSVDADAVNPHAGMIFESSALAYDAAKNGMGVAIGLRALVDEDLEKGHLVPAYDHVHRDGQACYLAYSQKLADDVRVKRFRNWLLKEGEEYNERVRFAA
jgi:LysR family glycine cleavage system transcriptional activator